MVDKNLFLHDLAFVAILKCEGPYLKEWLDYHLLAGVDHFYLYDNDSPDNQAEVAAPYVEAGLVDYFHAPGKKMQMAVYIDTVRKFRFHCRYMAFIDGDEFIYPKVNRGGACSITDVVDEILLPNPQAGGLVMNWQTFGSNWQDKADYSRGVLERFTYRCFDDSDKVSKGMNYLVKSVANPRTISFISTSLHPNFFESFYYVNETGNIVIGPHNKPVTAKKIVVNHYHCMSYEEYAKRAVRGEADMMDGSKYAKGAAGGPKNFPGHEYNDIFDDGILHYRAARAENFSLEDDSQKFRRVIDALVANLSTFATEESSAGKMETALTCRALSTYLREKFPDIERMKLYEEASLAAVLKSLGGMSFADARLFFNELPNLLSLPYPAVKAIRQSALVLIPQMLNIFIINDMWKDYADMSHLRDMLKIIKE